MTQSTVLILGANGRIGSALAEAFDQRGWRVIAQSRQANPARQSGIVIGDMRDVAHIVQSARDISRVDVVIHAANVIYTRWNADALPMNDAAIAISRALGATLMLPGNVYNFGADLPALLDASTPPQANTSKGQIRIAMERALRVAAEAGTQAIVIRAGDFFGAGTGNWFDQAIVKDIEKGKLTYPGPLDLKHAWAYLPDLAATFVNVAEARSTLAPFENIHFAGHTITGQQLMQAIRQLTPRPLKVAGLPWWLIRVVGVVKPMWRDLAEMSYLWRRPHQLITERAHAPLMAPTTPLERALQQSLNALRRA